MTKFTAALACALGALAIAGPAGAGVSVGVNDDAGKYADGAPQFWQTMQQNGLKQNAVTVLWDETRPTAILDESFIRKSLPAADAAGVKVVFDVYPMHSQAFTQNGATPEQFGAFLTKLATTFPSVTEYVVMNECNQTRFVNPQFDGAGQNQSAAICGKALAAGYDALKAVNPDIFVWGVGLSPRGNDNAQARSNVSTSPVKFLAALGQWYRASGRTAPLMDGFDFHPYPIPQSLPFATGYADTDNASVSNLPRIYQAFYDAFRDTGQPTIGPGNLPVSLNEVGVQTDNTGKAGYTGTEVSATGEGGVRGDTATESFQSAWYLQMLNYVACDPSIKVVNLFHLVDESDLGGWQSGLYYVGYAPKASAAAVSGWIAQTGGNCTGASKRWTPAGGSATPDATATDAATAAKLEQLRKAGLFNGMDAGTVGDLQAFVTQPGMDVLLAQLFAPAPSLQEAFGSVSSTIQLTTAYFSFMGSQMQAGKAPNVQLTSQFLMNVMQLTFGKVVSAFKAEVSTFLCGTNCSTDFWANVGALPGFASRSTASASAKAAPRAVAVGKATARAGKQLKVKMRAVKGAKRAYGRYVLVLRMRPLRGTAQPATIAVSYRIAKAKPAKKAKHAKNAKHAAHGKGKAAKPKPAKKR